ncbi:MAG: hypothetical protein JSW68_01165 [Burkholderiales bacterium]|nr:MAG: hypothetical protein JSW68_01165 [Burkholderiales bacterium]
MSTEQPLNVLFPCTGNSARSIIAESILKAAAVSGRRFRALSAGGRPQGSVDRFAIEPLQRHRIGLFASLPLAQRDRLSLQRRLVDIGRQSPDALPGTAALAT